MTTKYRITYWRHIPSMITVSAEGQETKVELPPRFQTSIDAYAMAAGLTGTDEYMEQWQRGPWIERDGSPEEVAQAVLAALETEFEKIDIPKRTPTSPPPNTHDT
jgi:hypothetical protein